MKRLLFGFGTPVKFCGSLANITQKEIISLATKAGVSQGAIVDTNQSLVDNNQVMSEKIGGTIYFWSFPSRKDREMLNKLEAMRDSAAVSEERIKDGRKRLAEVTVGREEDSEGTRAKKVSALSLCSQNQKA